LVFHQGFGDFRTVCDAAVVEGIEYLQVPGRAMPVHRSTAIEPELSGQRLALLARQEPHAPTGLFRSQTLWHRNGAGV
jgi:hypothetical protein